MRQRASRRTPSSGMVLLVLFLGRSEEEVSGSDWAGKQICREATWVRADRAERDDVKVGKSRGPGLGVGVY